VWRQVVDTHGAGGNWLRAALHFDQTHAAVACDRQTLVVTEAGDLHAGLLAGLNEGDPVLDLDRLAVDDQLLRHCRFFQSFVSTRAQVVPDGLAAKRMRRPRMRPAKPNQNSMGS